MMMQSGSDVPGRRYLLVSLWLLLLVCWCGPCVATTPDQQLAAIEADLQGGRLSLPVGANAMEKIEAFRQQWPLDWRVLPLAYRWSERRLQQAWKHFGRKEYVAAAQALEQIWWLVPLTPGLEVLQDEMNASPEVLLALNSVPTGAGPTESEEDFMVENYRPLSEVIHNQFRNPYEENAPPLARFELPAELVGGRDKAVDEALLPLCQAVVDNRASVVVHTEDRVDYSWLTVRLTLCVRRIDGHFRLRHSYRQHDGAPVITLHPGRDDSLKLAPDQS